MIEANRLGEKNKKGFYKYEGKNVLKDEEVYKLVEKSKKDFQNDQGILELHESGYKYQNRQDTFSLDELRLHQRQQIFL